MIQIQILEENDKILSCDYCRPLSISYGEFSDNVHLTSPYSGSPINNMKWVEVKYVLGKCWFGKTVKEYHNHPTNPFITKYEFARGFLPKEHLLDVSKHTPLDV